jgi:protein-S-isoprenylcysteine O-methyltransferase Ste14
LTASTPQKTGSWRLSRILIDLGFYASALALGAAVAFLPDLESVALAYFVFARLAYVLTVSVCLRAQSRRLGLEPRHEAERRYGVFHEWALRLQNIDGISFVSLCVAGASTLPWTGWEWPARVAGGLLIVVGTVTKTWAVRCLGLESYTWHDFFLPKEKFDPCRKGPYRWFTDPMYTVGYLQAYGLALVFGSWHGLAASLFAQASILLVNEFVEKPHFRRLCGAVVEPVESP